MSDPSGDNLPAPGQEEGRLIHLAARGDARACRTLVDQHLPQVLRLAARLLGERSEAEDVAQESFVRLWGELPRWRGQARVATWLYQVATRLCLDRLRRRRETSLDEVPEPQDLRLHADDAHQRRQTRELLERALSRLPPRQRAAVTLVHDQELTQYEAAAVLEISVDALESLLRRARGALRQELAPLRQELLEDRS
ncbi:MAG: sigma-70 family RNA polymerase sigma factor [Magnetococcus sp. WYHC-3]